MNLGSILANSNIITEEYERVKEEDLWMEWASDFDHGADWKVLPVFASESYANTNYGSSMNWDAVQSFLGEKWPRIRELIEKDQDRISLAAFSRLGPGAFLRPHKHENEGHLIFHMGIEIPQGAVGLQNSRGIHEWKRPGDWVLFDDTKIHSAWNQTEGERVVFYLDFIHQ